MFVFRLIGRVITFMAKAVIFVAAMGAIAGGVMYALFDSDQYKRELQQRVVDLTGRTLAIDGPVELQLGLPPRVVLNNVRVGNARWGSRQDMARIRRVQIDLNPLSAVSGDSSVSQVRLDGADVLLETNTIGLGNWEQITNLAGLGATGAAGLTSALGAMGVLGNALPPDSVILSDSTVTFRDGTTGRTQTLSMGGTAVQVAGSGTSLGPASGALIAAAEDRNRQTYPCDVEQENMAIKPAQPSRNQAEQPRR